MSALVKPNINIFDFSSREQALNTCKDIIASDLCPKWAKGNPANLLLVFMKGFELGLSVNQSMDGLCIINGKVSMYGDVLLGYCLALPDCEYIEEHYDAVTKTYTCKAKRKGRADIARSFSMTQAAKAGLLNKEGPWRLYPERMGQMRPRSWCLRDTWADKLMGVVAYEEAVDCGPRSNVVDFEPRVLEATKSHLNFLIQHIQLPQERVQKMLAWAKAEKVDLMSEIKAIRAIEALEKERLDAAKAWQASLVTKLQIKNEEGINHVEPN